MKLLSVNVGNAEPIATKSGVSGIFKRPQTNPVHIGPLGLEGDVICDLDNHGGTDQAVYVYGQPDYEWWSQELGQELPPGTFGENLVISCLSCADICVGDQFIIGEVVLEATSPRVPCVTLAARMGDKLFSKRFMKANRPGVYCRVVKEGMIVAPSNVKYHPCAGRKRSILTMLDAFR